MPDSSIPSSGTEFHSLQATSHALQPMQTDVSVKNPIRGGWLVCPACPAGSKPGPPGSGWPSAGCALISYLCPGLAGDPGPLLILAHQLQQSRSAWPPARPDITGQCLDLLDMHVRVQGQVGKLVRGVPGGEAVRPPVIRQPDLVQPPALGFQWLDPGGDHDPGLYSAARGDDRRPAHVLKAALGRQLRRDLAEEAGLEFGHVRQLAGHSALSIVDGEA